MFENDEWKVFLKTLHSYLFLYLRRSSSLPREEEQHQSRTESENLTKTTHQIKKKTWKCFSLLEERNPRREEEKHARSSPSCKRAPSSKFRRGQHRSTPHRFPSTAKSYFRWKFIALPRIEASFPAGRDKEKRATLFSRAKDNWRPVSIVPFFFSRANFALSLSVCPKKGARLRELTIVKCTYGFRWFIPRGTLKGEKRGYLSPLSGVAVNNAFAL